MLQSAGVTPQKHNSSLKFLMKNGKMPFSLKLTMPSMVMVLLVILLGISAREIVQINQDRTNEIVRRAKDTNSQLIEGHIKGAVELSAILNNLQKLNGTFYELLTSQVSGASNDAPEKALALRKTAEDIVSQLENYKRKFSDTESAPIVQGLIDDMNAYYVGKNNDAIFDVSSMMMKVDLNLILQEMENYKTTFAKLQKGIEDLSNHAMQDSIDLAEDATMQMENQAREMSHKSDASISKITFIFIGGSILSIVFSFLFAKLAARSLREMAIGFQETATLMIRELSQSSNQMEDIAQKVNAASRKTCTDSETMVQSVLEARENVQTVAASSEQLAQSSSEISAQISSVANISSRTAQEAEKTHEKVRDLNEIADHIGEVVNAIKAIAEQTNLLALNATIEAARAGAAGKGFAVVADEVKKLAEETSVKTEEVGDRVSKIQLAVRAAVDAVDKIIGEVRRIDSAASSVSSAVEEQSAATIEINRSVTHVSEKTSLVMGTVSTVIDSAHDNERAASVVLDASQTLSNVSNNLQKSTQKFISEILRSTR